MKKSGISGGMMRLPLLIALTFGLAAGGHAQTAPQGVWVMMCEMVDESGTGWVPEFLMFTRQTGGPNAGRIEVYDAILHDLVGHPIQAVVTADSAAGRSYGWALGRVTNRAGQLAERLDFRLHVSRSDGSATLEVTPQGYLNVLRGQGRCIALEK